MLFIDGTWLYYSIYERPARDCPLIQRYGRGWQLRYSIDWTQLPGILCRQLQGAAIVTSQQRSVEIVRASVYTSYKADTLPSTYRYKLFEDLKAANYDVHMMETVGRSEKCVDIQLAVEMLHYATTDGSGSYDVALLLTGDKDFMPAMIRTRQKGKAVGLVSMKRGCNRALIDTQGLKDLDVLWLEDYMDQLVVPKQVGKSTEAAKVSLFTLYKVVHDFIRASGYPRVASRDIGRYLKYLSISGITLLDEIKLHYVGLHSFLTTSGHFVIETDRFQEDKTDRSFWVSLVPDAEQQLMVEAKKSSFTGAEKLFFQKYSPNPLRVDKGRFYSRTQLRQSPTNRAVDVSASLNSASVNGDSDDGDDVDDDLNFLTHDFTQMTVVELKEVCREHGLPVSGVKAALIERIEKHVEEKVAASRLKSATKKKSDPVFQAASMSDSFKPPLVDAGRASYLEGLVVEYLHAKGGEASSRDLGRYLAANKSSTGTSHQSALRELKTAYGGLRVFLAVIPNVFTSERPTTMRVRTSSSFGSA